MPLSDATIEHAVKECMGFELPALHYLRSKIDPMHNEQLDRAITQMELNELDTAGFWDGNRVYATKAETSKTDIAVQSEEEVQSIVRNITSDYKENVLLEYSLNDSGRLDMLFSSGDMKEPLPEAMEDNFRALIDSWLKKNKLIKSGLSIYYMNEEGKAKLNPKTGEPSLVSQNDLRKLIQDKEKGLDTFFKSQDIHLILQEDKGQEEAQTPTP